MGEIRKTDATTSRFKERLLIVISAVFSFPLILFMVLLGGDAEALFDALEDSLKESGCSISGCGTFGCALGLWIVMLLLFFLVCTWVVALL
jgi:hypothetical protein